MIFAVTAPPSSTLTMMLLWFDVPVNELLLVHRSQTGGDLRRDFQRQLHLKPAGAFDKVLERFPLYKLHRVKVVLPVLPRWKTEATFG